MSNEDRLQREKILAEFLPFPLTAWLGLYMALKLHALMDREGGGNKKSERKGVTQEQLRKSVIFIFFSLFFFFFPF